MNIRNLVLMASFCTAVNGVLAQDKAQDKQGADELVPVSIQITQWDEGQSGYNLYYTRPSDRSAMEAASGAIRYFNKGTDGLGEVVGLDEFSGTRKTLSDLYEIRQSQTAKAGYYELKKLLGGNGQVRIVVRDEHAKQETKTSTLLRHFRHVYLEVMDARLPDGKMVFNIGSAREGFDEASGRFERLSLIQALSDARDAINRDNARRINDDRPVNPEAVDSVLKGSTQDSSNTSAGRAI